MDRKSLDCFFKRILDLVVASTGLVVLSPLFLVTAIVIKANSKGSVFYRGIRTGRYGSEFRIFKFRTMVNDAESQGGPSTGLQDPRLTSIGRVLRKYKIDELPNLINVARGEMSLVGPRPEVPMYTKQYRGDEMLILSVRPGITDLSSLRFIDLASYIGASNVDETFEKIVLPEKNRLRVAYVRSRSFFGDIVIIVRTLFGIFRGSNK